MIEHCTHYELWTIFEGVRVVGQGEGEICCQCDTVIPEGSETEECRPEG